MKVAHHQLEFPQQLRDLSGIPVVNSPFAGLLGTWILHVFCLAQALSAVGCFLDISSIPYVTLLNDFSEPLDYF